MSANTSISTTTGKHFLGIPFTGTNLEKYIGVVCVIAAVLFVTACRVDMENTLTRNIMTGLFGLLMLAIIFPFAVFALDGVMAWLRKRRVDRASIANLYNDYHNRGIQSRKLYAENAHMRATLAAQKEQLDTRDADIAERDSRLASLQERNTQLLEGNAYLRSRVYQLAGAQARAEQLESSLAASRDAWIMEQQLDEARAEIENANFQIADLNEKVEMHVDAIEVWRKDYARLARANRRLAQVNTNLRGCSRELNDEKRRADGLQDALNRALDNLRKADDLADERRVRLEKLEYEYNRQNVEIARLQQQNGELNTALMDYRRMTEDDLR